MKRRKKRHSTGRTVVSGSGIRYRKSASSRTGWVKVGKVHKKRKKTKRARKTYGRRKSHAKRSRRTGRFL